MTHSFPTRRSSDLKIGKVTWADHIDLKTGRPVEAPNLRYETGEVTIFPGSLGAHNFQPMSYSPRTGLVYIPYQQLGSRRSEEHTSELQSLMRNSYAVFCLKKKKQQQQRRNERTTRLDRRERSRTSGPQN